MGKKTSPESSLKQETEHIHRNSSLFPFFFKLHNNTQNILFGRNVHQRLECTFPQTTLKLGGISWNKEKEKKMNSTMGCFSFLDITNLKYSKKLFTVDKGLDSVDDFCSFVTSDVDLRSETSVV